MDSNDCCHRATLGVTDDVTQSELRRAYRGRLLRAHPDHGGSREELQQVMRAFAVLRETAKEDQFRPLPSPPATPRRTQPDKPAFSVLAARRYAQSAAAATLRPGVDPSARSAPSTTGGFSDVLQRAIRRIEQFQVDVLRPDYASGATGGVNRG